MSYALGAELTGPQTVTVTEHHFYREQATGTLFWESEMPALLRMLSPSNQYAAFWIRHRFEKGKAGAMISAKSS